MYGGRSDGSIGTIHSVQWGLKHVDNVSPIISSIRQHLSYDDCLEDKRKDYQNCSVLYCVTQLCTVICTLI